MVGKVEGPGGRWGARGPWGSGGPGLRAEIVNRAAWFLHTGAQGQAAGQGAPPSGPPRAWRDIASGRGCCDLPAPAEVGLLPEVRVCVGEGEAGVKVPEG